MRDPRTCPDCGDEAVNLERRRFLTTALGAGVALAAGAGPLARMARADDATKVPETAVKALCESLTPVQRKEVCFDWDFTEPERGLLRTRVSNNWHITKPVINSDFFTKPQKLLVRDIFEGIIQPDWQKKIDKQLQDDAKGFGNQQNIAIFGKPGDGGKFEFVMTGRHMTMRCDGHSTEHMAFGGPIFYGHAASGFTEKEGHPGNVFWEQALQANKVYEMLDGKQRSKAEVAKQPDEDKVEFRADGALPGISVGELSSDQKELVQKTLQKLIEPYRSSDQESVKACLKKQGGLEKCSLAFYTDDDLGNDRVWDTWRLEGPSFVWHFRGTPHVHVWVNIGDDPSVKLNAKG